MSAVFVLVWVVASDNRTPSRSKWKVEEGEWLFARWCRKLDSCLYKGALRRIASPLRMDGAKSPKGEDQGPRGGFERGHWCGNSGCSSARVLYEWQGVELLCKCKTLYYAMAKGPLARLAAVSSASVERSRCPAGPWHDPY